MNRLRLRHRAVDVRLQHLENEEVVLADQARVDELAFEVGVALAYQRRAHALSRGSGQPEALEFVDAAPRGVAAAGDFLRQIRGRDVDHAFATAHQHFERMVSRTDHAPDQRRLEVHHRVPRHRHDIRAPASSRRNQYDHAGLDQPVDLRQREERFFMVFMIAARAAAELS